MGSLALSHFTHVLHLVVDYWSVFNNGDSTHTYMRIRDGVIDLVVRKGRNFLFIWKMWTIYKELCKKKIEGFLKIFTDFITEYSYGLHQMFVCKCFSNNTTKT
jgi:hypothetical protein